MNKNLKYNPQHISIIKMNAQALPAFVEVRNKDWISFGADNYYPYYLIDLYNKSSKHNAIINGKTNYILGEGWVVEKEKDSANTSNSFVENLLKKANPYESLDEVSRKLINDFELFNGFAMELIWDRTGKRIASISHINFCNTRTNEDSSEYYYTKDWYITGNDGTKRKNREPEDADDWEIYKPYSNIKRKGKQLLYVKAYRPNLDVYPLPNYIGSVSYIDADVEIANYHYNNLKNGFTSTYMLKFYNGIPTEEEQKKIEKQIIDKLSGSKNAGKFILNFSDGKERSAEVEVIPMTDSDEQFNILNETVQQEIFIGHQITSPMLFGIKTAGQLGGRTEIIEANELFQNNYVRNRQYFIEQIFNDILFDSGIKEKIKLSSTMPIGIDFLNNNIWNILTNEERRDKIGLPKLKEEVVKSSIVDSLGAISPLIANKILENLTPDEMRNIIGLPPSIIIPPPENSAPDTFAFKKEQLLNEHILWKLDNLGEERINFETLESISLLRSDAHFIKQSERELFDKKSDYISKLNATDRAVIDLLNKDNLMPPEEIAKTLEKSVDDTKKILRRLEKNGILKVKEKGSGLNERTERKPIEKAIDAIEKQPPSTEDIFVKYSYEWRAGFSERDISSARPFCKELLKKDRLYTREEIEELNNDVGLNVWESRGGWYTQPGTDIHLPFCRHIWKQNLVRKIS